MITGTYKIAMAAGQDAGNRSAAAAGRKAWSADDWDAAAGVFQQVVSEPQPVYRGSDVAMRRWLERGGF